jgi:hypothetical protein
MVAAKVRARLPLVLEDQVVEVIHRVLLVQQTKVMQVDKNLVVELVQ